MEVGSFTTKFFFVCWGINEGIDYKKEAQQNSKYNVVQITFINVHDCVSMLKETIR